MPPAAGAPAVGSMRRGSVRTLLAAAAATALFLPLGPVSTADHLPPMVPEVLAGFALTPLVAAPVPTALAWGPNLGADLPSVATGPDLYMTTLANGVWRVDLEWTPTGPVVHGAAQIAGGFTQPLGLLWGETLDAASPAGAIAPPLYVADSHPGAESGRTDGRITRLDVTGITATGLATATRTAVVDGLPNGRHNTNHMRWGPDGLLYVANGNPNDNGVQGGAPDVHPYSGAILRFDAVEVSISPAVFRWRNANGQPIPPDQLATHAVNADFVAKVDSFAYGFRNVFGIAHRDGAWYTATNGADNPASQDTLYRIVEDADHGFPACFDVGRPGAVGAEIGKVASPTFPGADCTTQPKATALLGWHTCTTGLDFPTTGMWQFPPAMQDSVFVAECATFFAQSWFARTLADPTRGTHNTSHKVVRVPLRQDGQAMEVQDFVTGLALPTDVLFGPDGSMIIADAGALYRVAPLLSTV